MKKPQGAWRMGHGALIFYSMLYAPCSMREQSEHRTPCSLLYARAERASYSMLHALCMSGASIVLDINVTIQGDKVVIEGLQKIAAEMPHAVQRGLERSAKGIHIEAYKFLSGSGSKASRKKGGAGSQAGSYPVPVVTGHLRRMLDWLKPGESKTGDAGTFTAGPAEAVIYDSAIYANVIHEGRGSSAKFGPRRYLADALEKFNQGARIKTIIEEEIQKEIDKRLK